MADRLIFFGGTALARTYLPNGRLSEDIDLISVDDRSKTAEQLTRLLDRGLRSTHGRLRWSRPLASVRDIDPVIVSTDSGIHLRIQLIRAQVYARWPVQLTALRQRYSDVPPARLIVPTRDAFVG